MKLNSITFALALSVGTSLSISIPKGIAESNEISQIQRINISAGDTAAIKLSTVKNQTDLIQSSGRLIKLIGYYVSQSWNPGMTSNTFEFKGIYNASQMVLEDGSIISIFMPGHKQSLRSSEEVNKYKGKIVEVIGVIKPKTKSNDRLKSSEFFIDLKELKLIK